MTTLLSVVQTVGGLLGILSAAILISDRLFRHRPYANFMLHQQSTVGGGKDLRLRVRNTAGSTVIVRVPANVQGVLHLSQIGANREVIDSVLRQMRQEHFTFLLAPDEQVDLRAHFRRRKDNHPIPDVLQLRITWSPAQRSHVAGWFRRLPNLTVPLNILIHKRELEEMRRASLSGAEVLYGED